MAKPKFLDPLTHLAIDTSVLIGAGWPYPTVELNNIVRTCNALGVEVIVPELVFLELAAIWKKKIAEEVQQNRQSVNNLSRRTNGLLDAAAIAWPTDVDLSGRYSSAVVATLKDWDVKNVPLPSLSLKDAVTMAVNHEPPFPDEDTGFRDALVTLSVIGALPKDAVLGLLAHDKFFAGGVVLQAAKRVGVTLRVFTDRQQAWTVIEDMARVTEFFEVFEKTEQRKTALLKAVDADRTALNEFVRANLKVPKYLDPYGMVMEVHEIAVGAPFSVAVELPLEHSMGLNAVANVEVTLHITAETPSFPTTDDKIIGVGSKRPEPSWPVSHSGMWLVEGQAAVGLKVQWPDDKDTASVPKFEYVDASFRSQTEITATRQALIDMMLDKNQSK